ncbi:MAG: HNH endonuclease signature motif containing protein [Sedimentisphaerales bacterium]
MSSQSTIDFLTFTISGRTVKVDPDIYYQIFNIRPARPHRPRRKYVNGIVTMPSSGKNYPVLRIGKNPSRYVRLQCFIMNPPEGMVVDHINHDGFDNRRENLRICTQRQNTLNRKYKSNTGFAGVNVYIRDGKSYCRARFRNSSGKTLLFHLRDNSLHRILAAYAHDKFVLQSGDEEYAPLNFDNFRYEPFRTFLLEIDLNRFKLKILPLK